MTHTHWKKLQNPDYIGAYALEPGQEIAVTIKTVRREMVTGPDGKKEECTILYFIEPVKPMILNTTNSKTIEKIYKTPYIEEWEGKKIQLFADKVKAFGEVVEALRIRPFVPREKVAPKEPGPPVPELCEECKCEIEAFEGRSAAKIAQYTKEKYGRALCAACAKDEAGKADAHADE